MHLYYITYMYVARYRCFWHYCDMGSWTRKFLTVLIDPLHFFPLFFQTKLARKFRIQGIPALIILDADAGTVITTSGVAKVTNDPSGAEFPWKPKAFSDIIQGKLLKNKVGEVDAAGALKGKVVGLYFSAHWVSLNLTKGWAVLHHSMWHKG